MSNLKKLRVKNKMTQDELAKKLNVTQKYISFLESGERIPSLKIASKASNFFDCSIEDIFLNKKSTKSTQKDYTK